MTKFPDLTITSIETITAFTLTTGEYWFTLDELQSCTIENNEETTDITGKQGRLLSRLKKNKTVTISGDNGMLSGGLLEVQTGGTFEDGVTDVLWTDYLTVKDNAAETSYKAVGTTGAEIEGLYIKNTDGTLGELMEQGDAVGDGVFTYDPDTKALAFSDIDDNTEIVVYYKRSISAYKLSNESDSYSGKAQLYVDAMGEDKCGNVYRIQIYIPKADFNGEFSFEMGDDQSVHSFEAESLAGACVLGGSMLWTFTVFGANAEDADEDTDTGDTDDGDTDDGNTDDGDDGNDDDGDTGDDDDGNDNP